MFADYRFEVDIRIGEIGHWKHVNRDHCKFPIPVVVGTNFGMERVRFLELVFFLIDPAKPWLISKEMEGSEGRRVGRGFE